MSALSPTGVPSREALRQISSAAFATQAANVETASTGLVHVRSYTRTINGKPVQVAAHTRADPPGGEAEQLAPSANEVPNDGPPTIGIQLAARRDTCEVQRLQDDAICRSPVVAPVNRRSCWASVMERYSQCLRGGYIPPLQTGQ